MLSLKPDQADAHRNMSLTFNSEESEGLTNTNGVEICSSRRRTEIFATTMDKKYGLQDKRILLWSEQGLGDTINSSSKVPLISSQAKYCILSVISSFVCPFQTLTSGQRTELRMTRGSILFSSAHGRFTGIFSEMPESAKFDAFLVPEKARSTLIRRLDSWAKGLILAFAEKALRTPRRLPNYAPLIEWSPILALKDVTFKPKKLDFFDDLTKAQNKLE